MTRNFQHTLKRPIACANLGLHSGLEIKVTLSPWPVGGGVVFKRSDIAGAPLIPALAGHVSDTRLATTLGRDDFAVSTVEHLIAALATLGVDNVLIEVSGPEVPIMDGSALPWVNLIKSAGLLTQMSPRKYYRITRPFEFSEGDKNFKAYPGFGFSLKNTVSFAAPIGRQEIEFSLTPEFFVKELAPARTFCLAREIEYMQSIGLAKGGSLDNAVVVGDDKIINPEGWRFADEVVRHKSLDVIGDLALAGAPLIGQFEAFKPGHDFNHKFLTALLGAKGLLEPVFAAEFPVTLPIGNLLARSSRHQVACAWGIPGQPSF